MTTDQEMRQLADSATEGPWEANQNDLTDEWKVEYDQEQQWLIAEVGGGDWNAEKDAEFIAACRDWVPDALRRLEAVRELIDPSKAIRGSVASKILKILDGDQ